MISMPFAPFQQPIAHNAGTRLGRLAVMVCTVSIKLRLISPLSGSFECVAVRKGTIYFLLFKFQTAP